MSDETESFIKQNEQQLLRLLATFTVYDCFDNKIENLINFSSVLKSPIELKDIWFKAVTRTKTPLTYKLTRERYWNALQQINGPAELAQIKGQHLSCWSSLLFGNNPIDSGMTDEECWAKLMSDNSEVALTVPLYLPDS